MRRRDFITVIAGSAAAWPLAARAQRSDQMRRIGVLTMFGANDPAGQARGAALIEGLAALNWKEGGNLRIDWRATGGDPALYDRRAAELVALGPDVLIAVGTPSVVALRRRTTTIPIVFTIVTDPVGQEFVASLSRPGGNITGLPISTCR